MFGLTSVRSTITFETARLMLDRAQHGLWARPDGAGNMSIRWPKTAFVDSEKRSKTGRRPLDCGHPRQVFRNHWRRLRNEPCSIVAVESMRFHPREVIMSLAANIEHLAVASGIEAVCVDAASRAFRGNERWTPFLTGALDLFGKTEESSVRFVVGSHTIVVQQENNEIVAVVLPTGHAIAKSLRRMIRRMAKKDRGPLAQPAQHPLHAEAPSSPSSQPAATAPESLVAPSAPRPPRLPLGTTTF